MTLTIIHDNGIKGQYGASDEEIKDKSEIEAIIKGYQDVGITVYDYYV